ncbi:hypothetical protein PIB30_078346 [Stylosanthes scabra]|uniref:Uncharacterized protein n=1 Tax=Stylosanthes scabra TaxID=79078 RepID=A0ABU6YRL5_9FABA|nr:hypothetical protein [Stylosanthes scabra]
MDQPQPLVIRLHPNAVAHERQDGVWFQSDSPVVFQHADISTMSELQAVFLYHLGGGFTEIRKVGYRYLQRQPNGRFVHLLVWLFNDEHVRVTFGCHHRLMPQHVMDFLFEVSRIPAGLPVAATPVRIAEPPTPETDAAMGHSESEEDDSDYAMSTASSSDAQEGGAETRSASCPHYILPAPPPIPRVEDVPCFFQQLDLDEGACSDPLNTGMGNDYNMDGGQRSKSAIGCAIGKWFKLRKELQHPAECGNQVPLPVQARGGWMPVEHSGCLEAKPWLLGGSEVWRSPHVHCSDDVGRPLSVGQQHAPADRVAVSADSEMIGHVLHTLNNC